MLPGQIPKSDCTVDQTDSNMAQSAENEAHKESDQDIESQSQNPMIFQGRKKAFPEQLNRLFHPYHCELCKVYINSLRTAGDHYQSKPHHRRTVDYLRQYYPTNPWYLKEKKNASINNVSNTPVVVESKVLHCDLCNVQLTSLPHASQHYTGRRHKLAISDAVYPKNCSPTTKVNNVVNCRNSLDLCCKICNVYVSSERQLSCHLAGIKHQKKLMLPGFTGSDHVQSAALDLLNIQPITTLPLPIPLLIDVEMYRTPSGSYYCHVCDLSFNHVSVLRLHLAGKRHKRVEGNTGAIQKDN